MIRGHCEGAMFATKGALAPQRSTEGLCHEAVRSRITYNFMDEKRIKDIQKSVAGALAEERLKRAIDTLGEGIDELQDWELRTRYTEMQTAYRYMLEYLRQGMPDPDRERLHGS